MNAASIFGRTVPPMFTTQCGVVNLNILSAIVLAILLFSLAAVKTMGGILAFALIYGFFVGGGICKAAAYPCDGYSQCVSEKYS